MSDISPFLFPGNGVRLREATSAGVISNQTDYDIPNAGYSEVFGLNDCIDASFDVICQGGAAAGSVYLQKGIDAAFTASTNVGEIGSGAAEQTFADSLSNLTGDFQCQSGRFYRILNDTGQTINVWLQKRIR